MNLKHCYKWFYVSLMVTMKKKIKRRESEGTTTENHPLTKVGSKRKKKRTMALQNTQKVVRR